MAHLSDGRVAIFAACSDSNCTDATTNTWIFDPKTNSLSGGSPMAKALFNPAVASFDEGAYVMVAGGRVGSAGGTPVHDAELLNTTTGLFEAIDPMSFPRDQATATDLGNGRVLVAGGWIAKASGVNTPTDSAEVFDISTRKWSPAHPMTSARAIATATRLQDGRVLVAGGDDLWTGGPYAPNTQHTLAAAETYDPGTDTWQSAGNMTASRAAASSVLLPNGHVLVMGGWADGNEHGLATTDEYTPGGAWQGGTMPGAHALGRAVALTDGRVVIAGGFDADSNATAETDVYMSGTWHRTGDTQTAVYRPAAIALDDGRMLVVGGETSTDVDNPPAPIQVYWP